jgi:hypothetical protein
VRFSDAAITGFSTGRGAGADASGFGVGALGVSAKAADARKIRLVNPANMIFFILIPSLVLLLERDSFETRLLRRVRVQPRLVLSPLPSFFQRLRELLQFVRDRFACCDAKAGQKLSVVSC